MSIGSSSLQLNCNGSKQQNLHGSSTGIPERSRNTISICNTGALKQGSSPSPRRDDSRCHETRFHGPSSCAEHFRGLQLMVVTLEDPCDQDLFELVNYLSFLALVN
jgi:hypothetical protein